MAESSALLTLRDKKIPGFKDCSATAEFCGIINDAFDVLNCRNFQSRAEFCKPMNLVNLWYLRDHINHWIEYIGNLTTIDGDKLVQCRRKTGFLGFVINLTNLMEYTEEIVSNKTLDFVLSYKLSQDHLKMFFGSIRARGGFNNNPSALFFKTAYKRLLVKHQLAAINSGNCSILDATTVLYIGSGSVATRDVIVDEPLLGAEIQADISEYDYVLDYLVNNSLSDYVKDVVAYIAGFVVRRVATRINCDTCCSVLKTNNSSSVLLMHKQRGGLVCASEDVTKLCCILETLLRQHQHVLNTPNVVDIITIQALKYCNNVFSDVDFMNHIRSQDIVDSHRIQLIKLLCNYYIRLRVHHEARKVNDSVSVRQKWNKLVLFKHQ